MTHAEFDELMGYKTAKADYEFADFLYMQAGEMPKQEFVKEFKQIKHFRLVREWNNSMAAMSQKNYQNDLLVDCLQGQYKSDMLNLLNIMEENPHSFSTDMYNFILRKIGHKEVICYKINNGLDLYNVDKVYIAKNLK